MHKVGEKEETAAKMEETAATMDEEDMRALARSIAESTKQAAEAGLDTDAPRDETASPKRQEFLIEVGNEEDFVELARQVARKRVARAILTS